MNTAVTSASAEDVAQIGRIMSDLVAEVHGFVTDHETGELLDQRVLEIRASTSSLVRYVLRVARARGYVDPETRAAPGPPGGRQSGEA